MSIKMIEKYIFQLLNSDCAITAQNIRNNLIRYINDLRKINLINRT